MKGIRFGVDGAIEDQRQSATSANDPDALRDTIASMAGDLGVTTGVPLGVAVAGFVDPTRRIVQFSPNISWTNRPLAEELEDALGVSVVLENDANAACFAEFHQGAGRGASSLAMFTLGTGVGGAVMVGGDLVVGARGMAGELGHLPVGASGKRCGCGAIGCLETVASGTAIVEAVRTRLGLPDASGDDVTEILGRDDALRTAIFDEVAGFLAHAITAVGAVTDPDVVVIGGGVMERSGDVLLDQIRHRVDQAQSGVFFPASPRIVAAELGNRAGAIGAALLADSLPPRGV